MDNRGNLFWSIVWAVVFILALLGLWRKWAVWSVVIIAAFMFGTFVKEYIHVARMK